MTDDAKRTASGQKRIDLVLSSILTRFPFLAIIIDCVVVLLLFRIAFSRRERIHCSSSKRRSFFFISSDAKRGESGMRETGLESFESTDARGRGSRVPEGWTLPRC